MITPAQKIWTVQKILLMPLLITFLVIFAGCGGSEMGDVSESSKETYDGSIAKKVDDSGVDQPGSADNAICTHPPDIYNLQFSPKALINKHIAYVTVSGKIDFVDNGGDVSKLTTVTSIDTGNRSTSLVTGVSGVGSGTIPLQPVLFVAHITEVDEFTFDVIVSDLEGCVSNKLTGQFTMSNLKIGIDS